MPRAAPRHLALTAALAACTEVRGRAPADAATLTDAVEVAVDGDVSRDVAARPYDAPPCPSGLRVDGVVDRHHPGEASSAPGEFAASSPRALVVDDRGGAYLGGQCVGCGGALRAAVWRVRVGDGDRDVTWGAQGRAFDGDDDEHAAEFWSLARDGAGRLVAAGYAVSGGLAWPAVARFTADGAADETFGARGRVTLDPHRFGETLSNGFVLRALPDDDGVLVVGVDAAPTAQPGDRALLTRLRADGAVDATFGDGGAVLRNDLRGCFDARRDDGDYVVLCQTMDRRPALLRLDARGLERAWPAGAALASHPGAPAGMQGRTLLRDSSGAWLVVGAVTLGYLDADAPPAAVRFTERGEADVTYGVEGLAQLSGVRQTPRYTYANAAALACEDRLLVGANLDQRPLVAVLDREGRLLRDIGERGYLTVPVPAGATTAALTGIAPLEGGSRALVLTNFQPTSFSLASVGP